MAITGSGSLAISLSALVISAAFLLKGKFPFSSLSSLLVSRGLVRACVLCRILSIHSLSRPGSTGEKLWCVCALDAHNLSITFCCSHAAVRAQISAVRGARLVIFRLIERVLSGVLLQGLQPTGVKSTHNAAQLIRRRKSVIIA